jgi:peptidoglycan hydrolase-like protein with peptidoglycan-binding domain
LPVGPSNPERAFAFNNEINGRDDVTTAGHVLDIARKQLGEKESPANSNVCKFSKWYPMAGSPWCAMFVSWVLDRARIEGYKHAYTPSGAALFQQHHRWFTANPKPGDVVYFDFPDSLPRIQHVGFVEKVNGDGSIVAIEGNTSGGDSGSQDNGGGVFRRVRARSLIVGFGRPPYKQGGKVDHPETGFSRRDFLELGDKGADVRMWQRHLNAVMDEDLDVDGEFGPKTHTATKAFQKEFGLEVDGQAGPKTLAKMEKEFEKVKKGDERRPPTLELYDTGRWVKEAQAALLERGFSLEPDGADGEFGPATAAAVKKFKKKMGLPPVPVVGRRVWKELLHNQ